MARCPPQQWKAEAAWQARRGHVEQASLQSYLPSPRDRRAVVAAFWALWLRAARDRCPRQIRKEIEHRSNATPAALGSLPYAAYLGTRTGTRAGRDPAPDGAQSSEG